MDLIVKCKSKHNEDFMQKIAFRASIDFSIDIKAKKANAFVIKGFSTNISSHMEALKYLDGFTSK